MITALYIYIYAVSVDQYGLEVKSTLGVTAEPRRTCAPDGGRLLGKGHVECVAKIWFG